MPRRATTALSVGGRLRALRLARGLSQEALSQASGVSATVISRIERGAIAEPSLRTLRTLARVLDVTLDELAGEGGPGPAGDRRSGHG
jgi:transcriptional regulator with XRE-family HTH domain